jgi:hypothetical protein
VENYFVFVSTIFFERLFLDLTLRMGNKSMSKFAMKFFLSLLLSSFLSAASFQETLSNKRYEIISLIGERRLRIIEIATARREIYRITQLLDIPKIGEKTVMKMASVLGYWFEYSASIDICAKKRSC